MSAAALRAVPSKPLRPVVAESEPPTAQPPAKPEIVESSRPGVRVLRMLTGPHTGAESERFLYLPSLARVRRIAGTEAQESFVGSDFTYEDIGGREFDDYTYTLVNDTADNGASYTLESRARNVGARFPRVISTIRKDTFVVTHADIYGKRGDIQKIFDATRVERVGKYWTVTSMRMQDVGQKTRTELTVEKAEYDVGLTDDAFSRRELEKVIK